MRPQLAAALTGKRLVGRRLREFDLLSVLGHGTMGVVFKAHDQQLDRKVAVKVFIPATAREMGLHPDHVVEEARAAARLHHPHVVQVFQVAQEGEHSFLVMEYLAGGTLTERLAREATRRLPLPDALRIFVHTASALEHAHKRGIVHRDIKPSNLLFSRDGTVKIVDFGLAVQLDRAGSQTAPRQAGTAAYVSPEQCAHQPVTAASDVYSLGVVLFESLAGERPFQAESVEEMIDAHLHAPPPDLRRLNRRVPGLLAELIARSLAKNPLERPTSRELREVLAELRVASRATTAGAPAPAAIEAGGGVLPVSATSNAFSLHVATQLAEAFPYLRVLDLFRLPFGAPLYLQDAFGWPALVALLDQLAERTLSGTIPLTLLTGPYGAGKSLTLRLLAQRMAIPPVELPLQPGETRSLLTLLLERLHDMAAGHDLRISATQVFDALVETQADQTGKIDANRLLRVRELIHEVRSAHRTGEPLLLLIDAIDPGAAQLHLRELDQLSSYACKLGLATVLACRTDHEPMVRQAMPKTLRSAGREAASLSAARLTPPDIQQLLRHQLSRAGGRSGMPRLDLELAETIEQKTGGWIGPVNAMLHRVLMHACATQSNDPTSLHVAAALEVT